MAYRLDKRHPLDPCVGELDEDEIEKLKRRNRDIRRRLAELSDIESGPVVIEEGPYGEDENDDIILGP